MRYFFSTGEESGGLAAVALAEKIRAYDPEATFEGIGGERMRAAGFSIFRDNAGWATLGPFAALPHVPKMLREMWGTAAHVARVRPDLVVLVDFGAFNVRLAAELRKKFAYALPILDCFPPGAWLDSEKTARSVASVAVPMPAFERQYRFYRSLGLPVRYFGHPLAPNYIARAPLPPPPAGGGAVALLPGSRNVELANNLPRMLAAYRIVRAARPQLTARIGAADDAGERRIRTVLARAGCGEIAIARGVRGAVEGVDAAWVASGTAVLETALLAVPTIAMYALGPLLGAYARRIKRTAYVTLPNLVLDEAIVPELLLESATPEALAAAMETLLRDPSDQYANFARLRAALGPSDALDRWAEFAVALARAGAA